MNGKPRRYSFTGVIRYQLRVCGAAVAARGDDLRFGRYELAAYRLDALDRATAQTFEMQGSTLFEGNATDGCCYQIGSTKVWDLTPNGSTP